LFLYCLTAMAATFGLALLGITAIGPSVAQIAPEYAQNVTVYHLNPVVAGAIPLNMDTGDAAGDLFFYLGQFLLPLECENQSKQGRSHFDCDNPERKDPNLVVTKVEMEVDSRLTSYSACNLCNGTDPFSGVPCKVGTYSCDCPAAWQNRSASCDATRVGRESVKEHYAPHQTTTKCAAALKKSCGNVSRDSNTCGSCIKMHYHKLLVATCDALDLYQFCPSQWYGCNSTSPEWMCWAENIPRKTEGQWYSTLQQGLCNTTSPVGSCSWKVLSTRTIREPCLKNKLMSHVESTTPSCFASCGPRDMSSPCWVGCFFDAVLGPEARHSTQVPLGGLPTSELERTWSGAFLPVEDGGCEHVDMRAFGSAGLEPVVV